MVYYTRYTCLKLISFEIRGLSTTSKLKTNTIFASYLYPPPNWKSRQKQSSEKGRRFSVSDWLQQGILIKQKQIKAYGYSEFLPSNKN